MVYITFNIFSVISRHFPGLDQHYIVSCLRPQHIASSEARTRDLLILSCPLYHDWNIIESDEKKTSLNKQENKAFL